MKKKISVVTRTYNEETNIEQVCFAVAKEMQKTNYEYEHIVIDNCSTDSTISILVVYIKKKYQKSSQELKEKVA